MGGYMQNFKYKEFTILFITVSMFYSCVFFNFGSPDSPFINIVGRDLNNFMEYEKTGMISITDKEYTIIYQKKTHDQYTRANHPGDESYLIIKSLSNNLETTVFQGNLGHEIKYAFFDKRINHLYYTFVDIRNDFNKAYLITFDLTRMEIINKIMVMDKEKYDKGQFLGGGGYINRCIFDEINYRFLFQINHKLETGQYEGRDHLSLNINTGILEEISEINFMEILSRLQITENSFTYVYENIKKRLFFIFPYSDYLPANYKNKYNGIYINDSLNNIRISRAYELYFSGANPIWIENGQYLIYGSYIFDTSGRMEEVKIADGIVLAIF